MWVNQTDDQKNEKCLKLVDTREEWESKKRLLTSFTQQILINVGHRPGNTKVILEGFNIHGIRSMMLPAQW